MVLLGENLGGCHDCNLVPVFDALEGGERSHDRFAAADIALQQALHGMGLREVAAYLGERLVLGGSELERQSCLQRLGQVPARLECRRASGPAPLAVDAHGELLGEELVELDTAPRGM